MSYSPLTMKRRHVLGDICDRCDPIGTIPVYHSNENGEMLGYVDESLGHYADAFTFHLSEEVCKRLSAGYYTYSFGYEYVDNDGVKDHKKRVRLTSICITERAIPDPVGPRKLKAQLPETPTE